MPASLSRGSTDDDDDDAAWAELRSLSESMNAAALVLMRSRMLSSDAREDIGWGWGLCGWRRCGAASDAEKSLSVLIGGRGILSPPEIAFLVDCTLRSLDAIL